MVDDAELEALLKRKFAAEVEIERLKIEARRAIAEWEKVRDDIARAIMSAGEKTAFSFVQIPRRGPPPPPPEDHNPLKPVKP